MMDDPHAPATAVVVIEDEPQIRRFVRMALETEGCHVVEATTGERGLIEAGTRKPDLIILDLGLPDRDGVDVVRDLRGWSSVPILILSARTDETDKVAALDAGADDYLTKPFGLAEFMARVRALLRRRLMAGSEAPLVSFGDVSVDLARRQIRRNGPEIHLTPI
jgi:two-component system KDP operon response regulator KdpE